uniref:Uncharacterized protein n=1 Tax=Mustela putorius furo TaxID=9669 RepID=M3YVF6_MUSPF
PPPRSSRSVHSAPPPSAAPPPPRFAPPPFWGPRPLGPLPGGERRACGAARRHVGEGTGRPQASPAPGPPGLVSRAALLRFLVTEAPGQGNRHEGAPRPAAPAGPSAPRPAPSDPPRLKKIFLWPGGLLSAGVDPNATPQKRLPSATRFLTSQDSAHRVCGL